MEILTVFARDKIFLEMEHRNFFVTEISKLNFNIHTLSLSLSNSVYNRENFDQKHFIYIYIYHFSHVYAKSATRIVLLFTESQCL